jgi:hypothetical protein
MAPADNSSRTCSDAINIPKLRQCLERVKLKQHFRGELAAEDAPLVAIENGMAACSITITAMERSRFECLGHDGIAVPPV